MNPLKTVAPPPTALTNYIIETFIKVLKLAIIKYSSNQGFCALTEVEILKSPRWRYLYGLEL